MIQSVRHFLSLIRFSHTLFALPFALLAAVMAWRSNALESPQNLALDPYTGQFLAGSSDEAAALIHDSYISIGPFNVPFGWYHQSILRIRWQELVGILLCMVFARSAAMAFNRLVDRKIDAGNPRTAGRHLPAGILSAASVWMFFGLCSVGFVASTLLFLPNRLPLWLSMPVLALLCGYSFAKRFTSLAHYWLGAALGLSPIAAWIAIRGEAVRSNPADLLPATILGAAVLTWVGGFDILYACQDYEFDRQAGLRSIPTKLGIKHSLRLAAVSHAATVALLATMPLVYPWGWIYGLGIGAVAILLIYEHGLVRPNDLSRVNTAFFQVNAVISLGLLAVGTLDLLVGARG